MKLKYYSGAQVTSIIEKLPSKEYIDMLNAFAKEPSADVVEVVRCKDCKHWNIAECHSTAVPDVRKCMVMNVFTDPDQFCKYGERRRENG